MARPARSDSRIIASLRAELKERLPSLPLVPSRDGERRRTPRIAVDHPGHLVVDDLVLAGRIRDVASGGLFLSSQVLIETGEVGVVSFPGGPSATVRVTWIRGRTHPFGSGLGLEFTGGEQDSLEFILRLLDSVDA